MASDLARQLWEARCSGAVVDAEAVSLPTTLEAAYAVQREIIDLAGGRVSGFKIGSTSVEAQRLLGTTEPGSSPLLGAFVFESPAVVRISDLHGPSLEGEFAFRMARDVAPCGGDITREMVLDAVGAVAGAIEVVGTRFAGGLAGKGRLLTTADGGVNIALVTGPWCLDWRGLDLPSHMVRMSVDGEARGAGPGRRALGDPVNVLVWLANQQSKLGRGLKTGDIISTGTCTGLDPVRSGSKAVADFGTLGQVEIDFARLSA